MNKQKTERDARGQFAPSQADRKSDGVASAIPRSVTGKEDATVHEAEKKPSPNPGFDIRSQTNRRS